VRVWDVNPGYLNRQGYRWYLSGTGITTALSASWRKSQRNHQAYAGLCSRIPVIFRNSNRKKLYARYVKADTASGIFARYRLSKGIDSIGRTARMDAL